MHGCEKALYVSSKASVCCAGPLVLLFYEMTHGGVNEHMFRLCILDLPVNG